MNRNRMVFDRWPRKRLGSEQWQESSGDVPFYIELERPIDIDNGQHVIEVLRRDIGCYSIGWENSDECQNVQSYVWPCRRIC